MRFLDTRSMPGHLFQYAPGRQAFASQPPPFARCAILVGGLSDGMLACPYAPALTDALAKEGWATVQPLLRTSHLQFGFGSLDGDAEDLEALLEHLGDGVECALVGHSTGSQVAAHHVRKGGRVRHCVLQAGVSDRETDDADELARRQPWLERAAALVAEGKGDEFLPRASHWAPMTAQRYLDLHAVGGKDDYFSSDLSDAAMAELYEGWDRGVGCLVAYSGADEYAPPSVDKAALVKRICGFASANNAARVVGLVIPGANHNLSADAGAAATFVDAVVAFLTGGAVAGAAFDSSSR